jgi:probable phosphoglycerate mutase
MNATRLILWRHGVTDWNATERFQGQTDVPLNAAGIRQAETTAPVLAALQPTALYTSPLLRAQRTAQELAIRTGLTSNIDPDLMEIDVGAWSGLTLTEAQALDPAFAAALASGADYRRSLSGETFTEAGERTAGAFRRIAASHPGETVVIVSHGGVIRVGSALFLGWDYRTAATLGGITNCAWVILSERGARWRLAEYNVSVVAGVVGPSSAY